MHIPGKIDFNGLEVSIATEDTDNVALFGQYRQVANSITLFNISGDAQESRLASTLMHEIIEMVNATMELELEHEKISVLASSLFGVIRMNQLDFTKQEC
jgi:hypothetical protein